MSEQYYDQHQNQAGYDGAEHQHQQQQHQAQSQGGYTNDTPVPGTTSNGVNGNNSAATSAGAPAQYTPQIQVKQEYESPAKPTPMQAARKQLASWVGFSNLPNQVHRRANKWVYISTAVECIAGLRRSCAMAAGGACSS